jgi:hypothetical protein
MGPHPGRYKSQRKAAGLEDSRATAIVCPQAITNHNAMRPSDEELGRVHALSRCGAQAEASATLRDENSEEGGRAEDRPSI